MAVITGCFVVQEVVKFYFGWPVFEHFALSTDGLRHFKVWQLITFQFLHGGLWHLFGNLLVMWFFGRVVESNLGTKQFLKLYFFCGTAGGVLQALLGFIAPNYYGAPTVAHRLALLGCSLLLL